MPRDTSLDTVDVPLSDYVDVVDPDRIPRRAYINLTLKVPAIGPLPCVVRFADQQGQRYELYGQAGRTYNLVGPLLGPEGTKGVAHLPALSAYALDGGLPPRHAISGEVVRHLVPDSIGTWGVDEFVGWDMSAAAARIGRLQEQATKVLLHSDGRLFKQAPLPVWWADHCSNIVWLTRHPSGQASGATLFGLQKLSDAIRLLEAWNGQRPAVRGVLEHLDPAFDGVDSTVLLARELAAWAVARTQDAIVDMRADLVRSWVTLRHAPKVLKDDDAETAREIVREATGFMDGFLGSAGSSTRHAKELGQQWQVSKLRITKIEVIHLGIDIAQTQQSLAAV